MQECLIIMYSMCIYVLGVKSHCTCSSTIRQSHAGDLIVCADKAMHVHHIIPPETKDAVLALTNIGLHDTETGLLYRFSLALFRNDCHIFTAWCYALYAEHGYATVCHLSLRPSVTLRYRDHIGWNTSKIITRLNSLRLLLSLTPMMQWEHAQN